MKKILGLTAAMVVLMASVGVAQSVHFRGKIEDGEGACYYCPGFDYTIDCTDIPISSSVYNLNALIGTYVEAWGVYNGSASTPIIDITLLNPEPESFTIGGGGSIGGPMDFTTHGNQGDYAVIAASLDSGLSLFDTSIFMLNMNSMIILGDGIAGGDGEFEVTVELPNNPNLVGVTAYGQALIFPTNGGAPYFSNPDCKTISF